LIACLIGAGTFPKVTAQAKNLAAGDSIL